MIWCARSPPIAPVNPGHEPSDEKNGASVHVEMEHAGYPEEIPVRREPLIHAPHRVQGLPDIRLRPTAFLWSGPHLQNTDTAHQIVVEGTLGPAIQVVHILGGATPSRITRHDLLPDHLVRIEPGRSGGGNTTRPK